MFQKDCLKIKSILYTIYGICLKLILKAECLELDVIISFCKNSLYYN